MELPPLNFTSTATSRSESGDIYAPNTFSTGDFFAGTSAAAATLKAGSLPLTAVAILALVWLLHRKK